MQSALRVFVVLTAAHVAAAAPVLKLRTFGTGKSAFRLNSTEATVFSHTLTASADTGVLTHFWITGGPALGAGTDNATVRVYVDGEAAAAIEFKPPMAAGVGFDDDTVFGHAKAGHGSNKGGWYVNHKIPFGASVRVTVTLPAGEAMCYVIIRGCENLPVAIGTFLLPASARLKLHKLESVVYQPLQAYPPGYIYTNCRVTT